MAEFYSPIQLADLPETFDLLSSDTLYVFQEQTPGNYVKTEISFADLSAHFHSKDEAERLRAKTEELVKLSGEFVKWLSENYLTEASISARYSTISEFNQAFDSVNADSSLSAYLSEYATKQYGEYKLAAAKAEHEKLKLEHTVDYGDYSVKGIEIDQGS